MVYFNYLKLFSVSTMFKRQIQRGGGGLLNPYAGFRYQRGNGFFSGLIQKAIVPFLKYISKKGINKVVELGKEAIENPMEFKEIAKRKLKELAGDALEDGAKRTKKFIQTGNGLPTQIGHGIDAININGKLKPSMLKPVGTVVSSSIFREHKVNKKIAKRSLLRSKKLQLYRTMKYIDQ